VAAPLALVTGGAGFIGSHTAVALLERGYRVRAFDWLQPPIHEPGVMPPSMPQDIEMVVGDVRDKAAMSQALEGVELVVHLAAYQDYLPDFSTFFDINTVGTALIYELIVERNLDVRKVVVASSQAVYGEGRYHCPHHGLIFPDLRSDEQLRRGDWEIRCHCGQAASYDLTDEAQVNPQNQYALSKYSQEMVAFSLGRRYAIPTTCLRYSITQGPWQSPRNAYSGICRIFTLRALQGKAPIVYEDGLQMRDYVYVGDVARANLLALEDPRTDFEAYNVGGDDAISALDYAETVVMVLGANCRAEVPNIYRFGDTRHVVSDISKLRGLGWEPTLGVEGIISGYADWVGSIGIRDNTTDASIARMLELGTLRRVERAG
jgi:dTDP-L-rhamnose 4-epimerase